MKGAPIGAVGEQLSPTPDISVAAADAQCTNHVWTAHCTHSGPLT